MEHNRIIDAHIHCHFSDDEKLKVIHELKNNLKNNGIERSLLYLIDDKDFLQKNYELDFGENIMVSILLDPKNKKIEHQLDIVKNSGIRLVKLLPYEQHIFYEDFDAVCRYAKLIQDRNMSLTICGSYGSKDIYNTNGVELAAKVLNSGYTNPLIVAHGGMVRLLDMQALMYEYPNLYFDTSFTISYWWGSHIIDDLYFTLDKCDFNRVFYGSDYPCNSFEDAIKYFEMFCDRFKVSDENKDKLLYKNFEQFAEKYLE